MRYLAVVVAIALACACAVDAEAANPIQLENAKPGTSDWMLVHEAAEGEIEGYASATSVNQGQSISFYVNTVDTSYTLEIFRMGWYGGLGARRMTQPVVRTGHQQAIPAPAPLTGLIECDWIDPYTITIPSDWTSGAYVAKLTTKNPPTRNKYILFVVREDDRSANHNFQITVTTSQAYNNWGGKSLYATNSQDGAARVVSFNRPYTDGTGTGFFLWRYEYPALRFLEREGFDVSYTTNIDTHRRGQLLPHFRSFLSIGHDEYWSWEMRENAEAARAAGVSLGFFSANTCYWQVRFEPSAITGALDRTMVGYKEQAVNLDPYAKDGDPSNDNRITTKWRDAPVNRPESALIGVKYVYFPVDTDIVIDDVTSAPWVFAETGLTQGSVLPGLLGYEVDAIDNASPAGIVRLGHSPFMNTATNTTIHSDMTVYTAGASTVFATGSIQWAWGLDDWNGDDHGGSRVHAGAQQITRNVLRQFAGSNAAADCRITLSPRFANVSSGAGAGLIELSTASHCSWTASSNAPWLAVTSASGGTGNHTITYSFASNANAPSRSAAITIGDQAFVVTQASGCTYSLDPSAGVSLGAAGGNAPVAVTASSPACAWTTTTPNNWITITAGASGSGSGTIQLAVAPNEGPSRDGEIRFNGQRYNVHQSNGCTYSVQPLSSAWPASGGEGEVAVTTNGACFWSAASSTSWISLTAGDQGQGSGVTTYLVQPNTTGAARTGTFAVAGVTITVSQSADDCVTDVSPLWAGYAAAGATGTIRVSTACAWAAQVESGSSFLSITSTTNDAINYTIAANSGATARTGTIRVSGRAVNIVQNGAGTPIFALSATANGSSSATLMWPAIAGAMSYEVQRSTSGNALSTLTSVNGTTFTDSPLAAQRTYVYRVRAIGSAGILGYSNIDLATTVQFTDAVIVPGQTVVKSAHLAQLRNAVNAVRAAAALPSATFSAGLAPGTLIRAMFIVELRAALDAARTTIGLPPAPNTIPALTTIRAAHITDLRAGVQ